VRHQGGVRRGHHDQVVDTDGGKQVAIVRAEQRNCVLPVTVARYASARCNRLLSRSSK
jgi:hypothetical protein